MVRVRRDHYRSKKKKTIDKNLWKKKTKIILIKNNGLLKKRYRIKMKQDGDRASKVY